MDKKDSNCYYKQFKRITDHLLDFKCVRIFIYQLNTEESFLIHYKKNRTSF